MSDRTVFPASLTGQVLAGRVVLALVLATSMAPDSVAQYRRGSGDQDALDLIRRQSVRGELQVTEEEAGQLDKLRSSATLSREQMQPWLEKMAAAPDEAARDAIRDAMRNAGRQQAEKQLREVLGKERSARLDQLLLREIGPRALLQEQVAEAVSLSDQQKSTLQEVTEAHQAAREALGRRPDEEAREKLRQEYAAKYLEVLTPEQLTAWKKQLGPEVATVETSGSADTKVATSPESTEPGEPAAATTPSAPSEAPAAGTPDRTPQTPAVVSFAPSSGPGKESSTGKMSFNFRYAPWSDVLTLFAEAADLTLDLNEVPPGTFNYRDNQEYTPEEALDVLNGYLLPRGYILVKRNRFLAAVNIDNGIPPNLVPNVTIEELPERGMNELLSVVIPLQGIEAVDAEKEVEALLGPQGKVSSLSAANSLVVTDIGRNLRRVHRLLQNVTAKSDPEELTFQSYALRHIPATDAERITRSQLGLSPSSVPNVSASNSSSSSRYGSSRYGSSRDSRYSRSREPERSATTSSTSRTTQVTADPRTNRLLVTATVAQHGLVENVIKAIDISEDESGRPYVATDNSPRLKVYHVQTADPREVTKTLDAIMPGVVVNEDGRARKIHILATPAEHQQVEELIRQLDGLGGSQTVTVIPLARLDPLAVAATLRSLFAGDGDSAPTVESDTYGKRLMVRGTSDQLTQIRAVLTQLGEDGSGTVAEDQRQKGTVRTYSLGGRDPQEFLPMLERIWSTTSSTPIRVVIPSQRSPIRDRLAPSRLDDRSEFRERSEPDAAPRADDRRSAPDDSDADSAPRGPVGAQSPPASSPLRRASLITTKESADDAESQAASEPASEQTPADRAEASEPANSEPADQSPPVENPDSSEPSAGEEKPANPAAPVGVAVQGDQLIITSSDPEALDRMERLIESLSQALPPQTRWTVFYLRSADATETSAMLEQLFPSSSVASISDPNDTSLMGGLTGGISNFGQSVMDLAGLGSLGQSPQTLRIIPEARSNSLFVAGPAAKVREVEEVLKILDATELPESLRERVPRMIPVEHADVDEVYEIVKSLYSDYMSDPNSGGGRGGRGNPLQMLMGGGGGNSGGRGRQPSAIRLTLSVDNRTNQLLVSASDSLFRQIEELVGTLDQAAYDARQTVRIVTLDNANAYVVQQTLGSVLPKVHVSTTGTPRRDTRRTESSRESRDNGDNNDGGRDDAMRQLMEQRFREQMRQRFQQRGGSNTPGGNRTPGGGAGNGRSGGTSPGRGFQGRRGSQRDR